MKTPEKRDWRYPLLGLCVTPGPTLSRLLNTRYTILSLHQQLGNNGPFLDRLGVPYLLVADIYQDM